MLRTTLPKIISYLKQRGIVACTLSQLKLEFNNHIRQKDNHIRLSPVIMVVNLFNQLQKMLL